MSRPSRDAPPPLDIDVPAIPLSAILRYRHRKHQKAMALGYGIAVVMIVLALASRLGVVLWFGIGFALATRNLGQRICRTQGCRAFARKGR
jgi:hypothetical protein